MTAVRTTSSSNMESKSSNVGSDAAHNRAGPSTPISQNLNVGVKKRSKPRSNSMVDAMSGGHELEPSRKRGAPTWVRLRRFCDYMADHQIDVPIKVILPIVIGYVLNLPLCWRFIRLSHFEPSNGLYGKGLGDIPLIFFWITVFTVVRAAVMRYILTPIGYYGGIRSRRKLIRFAEQGWAVIYCSTSFAFGAYLCYHSPYWFNTSEFWIGYPHIYLKPMFKYYYLVQFSYWLQQIFVLQIEAPRKDYRELVAHHINTLLLVSLSYACNFTRVGNAVFACMDAPDALLALAKSLNYLGFRLVCDILFVLLLFIWCYLRVYLYGCIIWSTLTEPDLYILEFKLDPLNGNWFPYFVKYIIFGLMFGLFCLILFWTFLMFRILARVVMGTNAKDDRSDDEEEEEPDSATTESTEASKKTS